VRARPDRDAVWPVLRHGGRRLASRRPGGRLAGQRLGPALGRDGLGALVEGFHRHATAFATGIAAIGGATVENDVVFTQLCASFGSDERTARVAARLMADGTTWMTGSRWHDKAVLRVSVSNWSTTDEDVARSLAALRRAAQ
jgi:glutamate/tyrosine decarboxylase-like PLP-dependent enzyme